MKKITKKGRTKNGTTYRKKIDLPNLLNYGIASLLNQSVLNEYDLPIHHCNPDVFPDYIALNTEIGKFHFTQATAVAFFSYDRTFDGINGLYNAIYYQNQHLLQKYKHRYKDVRFVIAPDFSLFDDIWLCENLSRLLKIRIIMLWFVLEIGAVVIPNAIYLSQEKLPFYLSGLENCSVMCFNVKGQMKTKTARNRVKETIRYVVDHFHLKAIIVYSVCCRDEKVRALFKYASERGIQLIIAENTLRSRNRKLHSSEVAL